MLSKLAVWVAANLWWQFLIWWLLFRFCFSCVFCWIADSFLIWGSSRKSHQLCFGVSSPVGFNNTLLFTHTLGDSSLPTWMRSEFISPLFQQVQHHLLHHRLCSRYCITFTFLSLHSKVTRLQTACVISALFLWMPNESPHNCVNCSTNNNFRHNVVLHYARRLTPLSQGK